MVMGEVRTSKSNQSKRDASPGDSRLKWTASKHYTPSSYTDIPPCVRGWLARAVSGHPMMTKLPSHDACVASILETLTISASSERNSLRKRACAMRRAGVTSGEG